MARKGDGIYKRGKAWWLEFRHQGTRFQLSLGRNIPRSVAAEIAIAKRSAVLRGEIGIRQKRLDMTFEDSKKAFLEWSRRTNEPRPTAPILGPSGRWTRVSGGSS